MIVDPSAIIAILKRESDAEVFMRALAVSVASHMTAAGFVEACIAADNPINKFDRADLYALLISLDIDVLDATAAHAARAAKAHTLYGRWSGSPAKLNFGDCFSYALAMERDEALLFKGDDFRHTDVKKAY